MTDEDTILDQDAEPGEHASDADPHDRYHDHDHDHEHHHDHDHDHDHGDSEEDEAFLRLKEAILVERTELGPLRLKLTITVPREAIDERYTKEYAELQREAVIPGFRKGRAPMKLVEKRFADDVGKELKGKLIGAGYMAALEKTGLKPLGDPRLWVKVKEDRVDEGGHSRTVEAEKLLPAQQAIPHLEFPKDQPLTFACELELKPEFELPSLEGVPVKKPVVSVTDADVEEELRRLRLLYGRYEPVESGSIQPHDLLYVDLRMLVDGSVVAEEANVEVAARDSFVRDIFLTGLGEKLVGRNPGDKAEVAAEVPADYDRIDLRGKQAKFELTVREIKRLTPPPLDEAFLSMLDYSNEQELRDELRNKLDGELRRVIQEGMRRQVAEHLLSHVQFDLPEGLSQRQTERAVARRVIEMIQNGVPDAEIAKEADELRAKAREQTGHDLKLFFILEKIAEEREINVEEEEMNAAIAGIAARNRQRFDRVRDELSKGDGLSSLYLAIRERKVLDQLLETASVREEPGPKTS